MADMPQRDEGTGLYGEEADGSHDMKEFRVPLLFLTGKGSMPWRQNIILLLPSGESLNKAVN